MAKDPREVLVRNLILLQRISNTLGDEAQALLRSLFDEIAGEIAKLDPTGVQPRYREGRLAKLEQRVREIVGPAYTELAKVERGHLANVGAEQARSATGQLRAVLGAGAEGQVASSTGLGVNFFKALVDTEPLEGALLRDWFRDQSRRTTFRTMQQIRLGMANAETLGDIVRRVRGRSNGRGGFTGGVLSTSTREAEAIVRTAVSDVNSHAQVATWRENRSILKGYVLVVTFDGRTSPTCIQFGLTPDKVYDIDSGPRPPFHIGCRTATAPAVDWKAVGLDAPPPGTRATATGQVSVDTDFDDWLRSAPKAKAVELFGPARAKLFHDGKVDLRSLLKNEQGRVRLTPLADLAA